MIGLNNDMKHKDTLKLISDKAENLIEKLLIQSKVSLG